MRRLDGNATPEVPTFGPTSGGISGAVGIVCGLGLAASTLSEGVHPSELPYLFAGLAFVAASWALLLRPRIRLHPRDLELRNAFSSFRIPYAAISGLSVRSYTVVQVGERRYVGLAVGRTRGSMTRRRRGELLGQATLSGPPLTAIVVVVAAVNAVLAPVAVRVMRWARVSDADHRRQPFFAR